MEIGPNYDHDARDRSFWMGERTQHEWKAPSFWLNGIPYVIYRSTLLSVLTAPPGDVNRDQAVDVRDVVLLLRLFLGLETATPEQVQLGDVRPHTSADRRTYGDGAIRADDLNWVLRRALQLETEP